MNKSKIKDRNGPWKRRATVAMAVAGVALAAFFLTHIRELSMIVSHLSSDEVKAGDYCFRLPLWTREISYDMNAPEAVGGVVDLTGHNVHLCHTPGCDALDIVDNIKNIQHLEFISSGFIGEAPMALFEGRDDPEGHKSAVIVLPRQCMVIYREKDFDRKRFNQLVSSIFKCD